MSLIKIFSRSMLVLGIDVFSLISLTFCDDSNNKSIYAETIADYTWEEEVEDDSFWSFQINFIAEEGLEESIANDGKTMKNHPIESHYAVFFDNLKRRKGYKPGIKPLKHQKIKIKYEKDEPIMFYPIENLKYQDEQGNIVELK